MFTSSTCSLLTGVAGVLLTAQSFAQSITGTVVDTQNNGIPYALVSKAADPSKWAKADKYGRFVLPNCPVGERLRVAALNYQLLRTYATTSAAPRIQLVKETDVFHISFDHLRPGAGYSEAELKLDLPTANGIGFEPNNPANNRATVDNRVSVDAGGQSLKVRFPAGKLKTAESGVDARIALGGRGVDRENDFQAEELYLSYWIKFSDNFEFDKCGGKLPSLGGTDFLSSDNRWKGRIMWRNQGSVQFYMELPHQDDSFESDAIRFWGTKTKNGGSICTNEFTSYLKAPGWHNIELHYKLDRGTSGVGFFEGWVDGGKGHKIIDSKEFGFYRPKGQGLDKLTLNSILLSAFLGGSDLSDYAPTQDTYAWFDEFRVSRTRINEYAKYAAPSRRDAGPATAAAPAAATTAPTPTVLYPNPSQDGLFRLSRAGEWEVVSGIGRRVQTGRGDVVDLRNAPRGIYLIRTEGQVLKARVE